MPTTQARMFQRRRTAAQWTSENPTLANGEIGYETDTRLFKFGDGVTAWTSLPYGNQIAELVAAEPTELDFDTVADVTTATLLDPMARRTVNHIVNQYYWTHYATSSGQALTLNQVAYVPVLMQAGTVDRLGIDVSTAAATATARVGIYTDNGGTPGTKIAEATTGADTYPLDCSTTGAKTGAITAVLQKNGIYWFAVVNQTAAISIQGGSNTAAFIWSRIPLGTSAPTGTNSFFSQTQNSVTGAIPTTATPAAGGSQVKARWHFRYSAVS